MFALFSIRFLICSLVLSILIGIILVTKKILKNHISSKFQYYIWFIFLLMLFIPFIPKNLFSFGNLYDWIDAAQHNSPGINQLATAGSGSADIIQNTSWLKDYSISVDRTSYHLLNIVLLTVWIVGMGIMAILTYMSNMKILKIKRNGMLQERNQLTALFDHGKQRLNITKKVELYTSPFVNTPITFGFTKPCVILPEAVALTFSPNNIYYIFLHELQHYKSKDVLINYVMCFFRVIYWFHPFVWYALKEMKADREIACDTSVLKILDEKDYMEYGNTIINFADKFLRFPSLSNAAQMGGTKKQTKQRIINIASFHKETIWIKVKSLLVFVLVGIIVSISIPLLNVTAALDKEYKHSDSQMETTDLSSYFGEFDGSFVLYDLQKEQYEIYNQEQSTKRFSPASTYKIYSALFALESGYIKGDQSTLPWDKTVFPYEEWNKDQTLNSAMKHSVNWYFQTLDQKMGLDKLKSYYEEINYGNLDFSAGLSDYWAESSLKVSALEQVDLLKSFYMNDFNFKAENIQTVKDAMVLSKSNKNNAVLSGKTGTGNVNGKNINGWFIGYVENENNTYFFATNIQNIDNSDGSRAAQITLSILKDKNIYDSN